MTDDARATAVTTPFYLTGGTMPADAPSYIERKADTDLLDCLLRGEYCYLLNARQIGKSSLMIRTANRLREEGCTVAVLDLTAVGQGLDSEQWYFGLLDMLGQQLGLEDELEDYWDDHPKLGPFQRWMAAIRHVVLPSAESRVISDEKGKGQSLAHSPRPSADDKATGDPNADLDLHSSLDSRHPSLVVFIDEIDAVRSLPFSTDEFFAGIRACYNARTEQPELERLTFCLLGTATPADLIADTRMSPFNIGRRIELADFTEEEAAPLATGLGDSETEGQQLLKRVLHWTNGHPYLTQRLCRAVADLTPTPHKR